MTSYSYKMYSLIFIILSLSFNGILKMDVKIIRTVFFKLITVSVMQAVFQKSDFHRCFCKLALQKKSFFRWCTPHGFVNLPDTTCPWATCLFCFWLILPVMFQGNLEELTLRDLFITWCAFCFSKLNDSDSFFPSFPHLLSKCLVGSFSLFY